MFLQFKTFYPFASFPSRVLTLFLPNHQKQKKVFALLLFSGNSFNNKNPYFNPTQVGG